MTKPLCRIGLYLWSRGLSGRVPEALRFADALEYHGEGGKRTFPAMLCDIINPQGETVGYHRTYLDPKGPGKAPVPDAKKQTPVENPGDTKGAALRLCEAEGDTLALAEGIETALAVHEATGTPVWATLNAGGLEAVELPENVKTVEIWADRDRSGRGGEAAQKALERLRKEGRDVAVYTPPILGMGKGVDWLDIFNAFGAKAFRDAKRREGRLDLAYTDLGNARRFVHANGLDVLYDPGLGEWYVWQEGRWREDPLSGVFQRARFVVRELYREAHYSDEPGESRKLAAHALKLESAAKLKSMVEMARSEPELQTNSHEWDTHPLLLNVATGTLDLTTGELRPPLRRDRMRKRSPVAYDPRAKAPRWETFIEEVTEGDEELAAYLQTIAGYSLTGDTREHAFFIHYGAGRNGKSVFLNLLRHVTGDYALQTSPETFLLRDRPTPGPTPELARLQGARLVCASETEENQRLSVALVKSITGGEDITARQLHKAPVQFRPQFKVHFATNHRPQINDNNMAIWARVHLVPWKASFHGREDKDLERKLMEEAQGILRWAVLGCLRWQKKGLTVPESVATATKTYQEDSDTIGQWIADCCTMDEAHSETTADLYKSYRRWADEHGMRHMSHKKVTLRLIERGCQQGRTNSGRYIKGLKVIP